MTNMEKRSLKVDWLIRMEVRTSFILLIMISYLAVQGGYRFGGNTDEIFEKFFGTSNPFTITLDGKFFRS